MDKQKLFEKFLEIMEYQKPGSFFICGVGGEFDSYGLPDTLLVCPADGLDGFAVYTKTEDYG